MRDECLRVPGITLTALTSDISFLIFCHTSLAGETGRDGRRGRGTERETQGEANNVPYLTETRDIRQSLPSGIDAGCHRRAVVWH